MSKKSVLISEYHHKELGKLSEAFNLNYYRLLEEMITYFKKTGINPTDAKNENPSKGLKELDKRMISFLKVQERDILKPLRQEVYSYSKYQNEQLTKFHSDIISELRKMNGFESTRAKNISAELNKQRKGLMEIAQLIDAKNKSGLVNKINNIFRDADQ